MLNAADMGRAFAEADAVEQAAFMNAAGFRLQVVCESKQRFETQCSRLAQEMNEDGKFFVVALAQFAEIER